MIQKPLPLIIRHGVLSLTMLSTLAASLVGGPAQPASARTQPQAIAAPQAGTYGSGAFYTGTLCVGLGIPPLVPSQNGNANGAPNGTVADLSGIGCQLTVPFTETRTGNVRIYSSAAAGVTVLPTIQLLNSGSVVYSDSGLAGLDLLGAQTSTLIYTGTAGYNQIRFINTVALGTGIDAVEAMPDPPLPVDPYGNFAQNFGTLCTNLLGANPDAALGAPDGVTAGLGIGVNCTLRVDLGKGHSSTGHLRIYSRSLIAASGATTVTLRDATGNPIQTFASLVSLDALGAQTTTLIYTGTTPYRFVDFTGLAGVSVGGIDALEVLPDPPLPVDVYGDFGQNIGLLCLSLPGSGADNAAGAPDGNVASLALGVGCVLRVDLGKGETASGNLRIFSRAALALAGASTVTLRDGAGNAVQTYNALVDLSVLGAQTTTLIYTGTTPYRFVDFGGLATVGVGGIDAVQVLPDPPLPVDPYGDYAQKLGGLVCTSILGGGADNVTGAPDGVVAALNIGAGCILRVDLGRGEEGNANLRIFSQAAASLGAASSVTLRNGAGNIVQTYNNLVDLSVLGPQTTTLFYTGTTPYRFVDFNGLTSVSAGGIDALQTLPDPPLPPDPYADFAQQTGLVCLNVGGGTQAEGAPDGSVALLGVGLNCTLLLDMGRLEEGVGNLTVYYAGLADVDAVAIVDLLDVNGNVLAQSGSLLQLNLAGAQSATLAYNGTTPYRYVRISNLLNVGVVSGVVDGVIAQSYNNGDTDGDGLPTNCPTPGANEECGGDPDNDGTPNHSDNDEDGDGIPTFCPLPGPGQECKGDEDADGILDYLDNDSLDNTDTRKIAPVALQGGSLLTYSIVLSNAGAVPLTLVVEDSVPAPLQIQTTSPAATTQAGNKLTWTGIVVGAKQTLTLTIGTSAPISTAIYSVSNIFSATLPASLFNNKFVLVSPAVTLVTVNPFNPAGDDDGDGILNGNELPEDTDGDGAPNYQDGDDDGDGIPTQCPAPTTGECIGDSDPDGADGIVDYLDNDSLKNTDSKKTAVNNGNLITYTLTLSNAGVVPLTPVIQDNDLSTLLTILGTIPAASAQTGDNDLIWTGLTIGPKQVLTLVIRAQYPIVGGPTVTLTNRFMATLPGSFRNNLFVSAPITTVITGAPTIQDDDGDGIPNNGELPGDTDGDGTPNTQDPDDDGDGIPTQCPAPTTGECIGDSDPQGPDGIVDYLDNDSLRTGGSAKTARATATVGDLVTYTLVLSNSGNVTLTPTLVDDVPARLIVAGSAPAASAQVGNRLTWIGLSIAPKARLTLVITTVASTSPTTYTVSNNFTATLPANFGNNVFVPAVPAVTVVGIGTGPMPVVDDDGDGIPNGNERPGDTDGDGRPDTQDSDDDGDGIPTQCPPTTPATNPPTNECMGDGDRDGIVDYLDNDSLRTGGSAKTAPGSVQSGALLTYSIVLRNVGAVPLTTTVSDNVPVSLSVISTSPAASSQLGQLLVWSNVVVPAGGSTTLTLVTRPLLSRTAYTVTNTFAATVFGGNVFVPANGTTTQVTAGGFVNPSSGGIILYLPIVSKQGCTIDISCR